MTIIFVALCLMLTVALVLAVIALVLYLKTKPPMSQYDYLDVRVDDYDVPGEQYDEEILF